MKLPDFHITLHCWDENFQWIPVETMVYQNPQGYYRSYNQGDSTYVR